MVDASIILRMQLFFSFLYSQVEVLPISLRKFFKGTLIWF